MRTLTTVVQAAAIAVMLAGCASTDWREDAGRRPADLPECQVGRESGPPHTSGMSGMYDRRCNPEMTGRGRQAPIKADFDK